ncbi:MAG: AAA family ATPase [Nitrospirae bacterium]|nr:MAG: AAA family ATPase [Nitrospirota bacterium]
MDSSRKKPVVWVSAAAGSGKTTLVSSYLDARKLPHLWYRCDEGDADIATFFYYMGLAAKKVNPRKKKPMPLLTPEYLLGIPTFTKRYFEKLYGRVPLTLTLSRKGRGNKSVSPPLRGGDKGEGEGGFVIVLDNYQDVSSDSQFHEIIRNGLSIIPEGINIVVISRTEPPPHFARLKANNNMSFVGWDDIRFTPQEAKEIIREQKTLKLKDMDIMKLYSETDGWIAGLILLLERMKTTGGRHPIKKIPKDDVFNYFANEVFQNIDKDTRKFLLITALLPSITPFTAERLTGMSNAGRILSQLSKKHFFTDKSGHEDIYRYHALFKEFLLSRIKDEFTPAQLAGKRQDAALLLRESGQTEDAVVLLRDAGDWDGLVQLILDSAISSIAQGRSRTLQEWIESIPPEIIEKTPWLQYWIGVCRMPFDPAESRMYFERAFQLFQSQQDDIGTLLSWSGAVDVTIYEWNNFTILDQWIDWLENRMNINPEFPSVEIEARITTSMAGSLLMRRPNKSEGIRRWINRAVSLTRGIEDANLRMQALCYACHYYGFWGDRVNNDIAMYDLKKMVPTITAPAITIMSRWLEALTYNWSKALPELGLQTTLEGLKFSEETGVHTGDHLFFASGVYSCLLKGDMVLADEFLKRMETTLVSTRRHGICQYNYLLTWYKLLAGDISAAVIYSEKALELALETGMFFPIILCHLETANVLIENSKYDDAVNQLVRANEAILQTGSTLLEYSYLLTQARLSFDKGEESTGLEHLLKAIVIARRHGYTYTFWWYQPAVMSNLCAKALEAGIEVEYVREIIKKRNLTPPETIAQLEHWPYPVKIYTLGRFEIVKDDKPLLFSGKVQKKPLEMLKTLVSFGGEDVPEEQIIDSLWPDADGDSAHKSFEITLNRLRKLLGNEKYIVLNGGCLTLNNRYCWTDIKAFEGAIKEAEKRWDKSRSDDNETVEAFRLTEKAMDLYRGSFMPLDAEQPWTPGTRERLENKLIRIITMAGIYYENRGHHDRAVEFYRKGIGIDKLAEELYQRLMLCYQKLGQEAEALKIYNRCRRALLSDLGITPSSRTEDIYNKMLKTQIRR